jgi:Fe-S-cluster containining protein
MAFQCPPDCGHCCTHLERDPIPGDDEFRAVLREHGIYHCTDGTRVGLSLSNAEADAMRAQAAGRKMRIDIHPRTFLLETRRRALVVLDWHMPYRVCPFYADYKCTAYDARPLVCRAYPVLGIGKGGLAPECPKMPATLQQLRSERKARRAIEDAHAKIDEIGWLLLGAKDARFVTGLATHEAASRARRYRLVAAEAYVTRAATRR